MSLNQALRVLTATIILPLFLLPAVVIGLSSNMNQETFSMNADLAPSQWRTSLSNDWNVLGPFPIHAREQHFISPGFPLNLTAPYLHEPERKWPSSLSEKAEVSWTKARLGFKGDLAVSFSDIRWSKFRATEGWAALQHHSILHTSLFVYPPAQAKPDTPQPRLLVDLKEGSFFTIRPRELSATDSANITPEWHSGNIYDMHRAPPSAVELPGIVHTDKPTMFDFFVSGDYEIRLFGDPRDSGQETPTLKISVAVSTEEKRETVVRQNSHDVVSDFVGGFTFGDALGAGLRSVDGWWKVEDIELPEKFPTGIALELYDKQMLAPSQTRIVPISIKQTEAYNEKSLSFNLILAEHHSSCFTSPRRITIPITIPVRQLSLWDSTNWNAIHATFFYASSHPTNFLAKPPAEVSSDHKNIPILALHGAGVDIISTPLWTDAIPRQNYSWVVMPIGRTEWGLDWHGPSASEAWETLQALSEILHRQPQWKDWSFAPDSRAVVIGHSNGGQGAWYLASRFPDRTVAVLPAAGYLSPAAYVPLTQSRGARFTDPALRSVLESAFMPDDNALFLRNLADNVPVLAVHGGNDTNVPTWHSREYVSIIKSWGKGINVSYHEDQGQPHWYPKLFESAEVHTFLENALDLGAQASLESKEVLQFTLSVADPAHSGSVHGWKIESLIVPGRLARLHYEIRGSTMYVRTTNVLRFSVAPGASRATGSLILDGAKVVDAMSLQDQLFSLSKSGTWIQESLVRSSLGYAPLRVQDVFDTPGPIAIIIPSEPNAFKETLSSALRIAYTLDVFLKLDCEIISDIEAFHFLTTSTETTKSTRSCMRGNVIIVGGSENAYARAILQVPVHDRKTEFGLTEDGQWLFRDRPLPSTNGHMGVIFTHPHPTRSSGLAVIIDGIDYLGNSSSEGLERVLRMLVPRTGIAIPDWIIVGSDSDHIGSGGIVGAGVWNSIWKWNEPISYIA